MDFHHFIITRFNVNIDSQPSPLRLLDGWLAERFDLFQRYCFPTVTAQTEENFTWLLLFDEQTSGRHRKLIELYARHPNIVPVFCGDHPVMPGVIGRARELASGADWLLTTRLDSDDALSINFVKCLHQAVKSLPEEALKPSDTLYINFPNGLQWLDGSYYSFRDVTNAFVSLLERNDDPHGVFWTDHPGIYRKAPVIQAECPPLWMQVLHEINLYNYLRGDKLEGVDFSREFPCNY